MSKKHKNEEKVISMEEKNFEIEDLENEKIVVEEPEIEELHEEVNQKKVNWKKMALIGGGILTGIGILAKSIWDAKQLNQYRALAALNGELDDSEDELDDSEDELDDSEE